MGVKHYLSQTYLKGFGSYEEEIYCYDKKLQAFITSYKITVKQIRLAWNLQKKPWLISKLWCKPDYFWTAEIEARMGKIETNFPKILEWINNQKISDNTELYDLLIQFISLHILRCQVSQKSFDTRVLEDKSSMINFCKENEFKEWEKLLEDHNIKNNRKKSLEYFLLWIENKSWCTYLNLRNRLVKIYSINGGSFITGDFPFYHLDHTEKPDIFFPITQNIMAVFWEQLDWWSIIFESSSLWSKQAISDMNQKLFAVYERYVFCSNYELISSMI